MVLKWFDARQATELGVALADQFVPRPKAGSPTRARKPRRVDPRREIQKFMERVDSEALPLKLNFYKKSKLANAFKWRLREGGVEAGLVDELTKMLLLRLTGARVGSRSPAPGTQRQ